MADRERLPNRRRAELVDFAHNGQRWTATVGRFADGKIAEVFLNARKESPLVEMAAESAIICSLALQAGVPLATLQHALRGRDVGPLAAALNLIAEAAP